MKEKKLMRVTHKLNTITLHQGKAVLTMTHENEILNFMLYNRALGNVVTSKRLYTSFEVSMRNIRKIMEFTSEMMLLFYAQKLSNF